MFIKIHCVVRGKIYICIRINTGGFDEYVTVVLFCAPQGHS